MKSKLLFLLFFTSFSSFAQYTLIPDVNFENKLISLGIDYSKDGKVLTSRIASIVSLEIPFCGIANLTGIQDFTALKTLDCSNNRLTTADFSKNIALTILFCANNELTALDVSKNVDLTILSCGTQLTVLDVSKNVALTDLYCDGNQLTALDVSKNVALKYLSCSDNQLNVLDVSKNLTLKYLSCSDNQLNVLDVSKNLALTTLDCLSDQLNALDVSTNVALEKLYCSKNQLTTLDVSKNTSLKHLGCYSNKLSSINVSKNIALEYFNCNNNRLTSLNLKNGKNSLLVNAKINLTNNPNLSCILVDDVAYSNANWSDRKDATATYSTSCSSLGITETIFNKIAVYPNPTQGEIYIDNCILEKATVYDTLGKFVKAKSFTNSSNHNTINLAGSPSGIYYIYLESEGTTTVKKIMVE